MCGDSLTGRAITGADRNAGKAVVTHVQDGDYVGSEECADVRTGGSTSSLLRIPKSEL